MPTDYTWNSAEPPKRGVYATRRATSRHIANRYWDGEQWWEVTTGTSRTGLDFKWPSRSPVREPRPPRSSGISRFDWRLRHIHSDQSDIQWGTPYRVYTEQEVLQYLVEQRILTKDWREAWQECMREDKYVPR